MKVNWKSFMVTFFLLLVLGLVVLVEISLFISGPARTYETKLEAQTAKIEKEYKNITNLRRHVFYYTTYIGEDKKSIVWFNVKGKAIETRKKSKLQLDKVKAIAKSNYDAKKIEISYGYGYSGPVYLLSCDTGSILLDFDTLKEVYFLKEGEV